MPQPYINKSCDANIEAEVKSWGDSQVQLPLNHAVHCSEKWTSTSAKVRRARFYAEWCLAMCGALLFIGVKLNKSVDSIAC